MNKKGAIGIIVEIGLIIVIGFLIWGILDPFIKKGANASLNPLKNWLGESKDVLDKQKESERVSKELLANAENVYDQFLAMLRNCEVTISNCICGTIDFTKLNQYYLKLSKEEKSQFLELLDANKVPVQGKRDNVGNFAIGPISPSAQIEPVNFKYILFSKDALIYNKDTTDIEKPQLRNKMAKVNILQSDKNIIDFDDATYGLSSCSEIGASFAYIKR